MPEPAPDHSRADLQHLSDRHARSRPNTAYVGSAIDDHGGGFSLLLKLVLFFVLAAVILRAVRFCTWRVSRKLESH